MGNGKRGLLLWLDDDIPAVTRDWQGYSVVQVKDCAAALRVLENRQIDGAVVDFILPQKGWHDQLLSKPGVEFIREIRSRFPSAPVAAYGILVDDSKRRAATDAGADAVFDKFACAAVSVFEWIDSALTPPARGKDPRDA